MPRRRRVAARRNKIHEEIAWEIHERILRGDFAPGERLPPERQLAEMFSASRGSVREAIRALELYGVVRSRHGGGNFVADTLPGAVTRPLAQFLERQWARLMDVSEARQLFEPRLAHLAAERATKDDVRRLRQASNDQGRRLRAGDVDAAFNADRAFHERIAEATRNETLLMLHNYLSDLVASGRREAISNEVRRTRSPLDHRTIYQAIARGDGPAASAAMLQHLENVEASLRETLQAYQHAVGRFPGGPDAPDDAADAADRVTARGSARKRRAAAARRARSTGASR